MSPNDKESGVSPECRVGVLINRCILAIQSKTLRSVSIFSDYEGGEIPPEFYLGTLMNRRGEKTCRLVSRQDAITYDHRIINLLCTKRTMGKDLGVVSGGV